jgi:hypothetical protein
MANFSKTFTFEPNLIVNIKRCLRKKVFNKYKFIPLKNSVFFNYGIDIHREPLLLPKLYAALTCLTGPGTNEFDDYKGSYSFTFRLNVQKNKNTSDYFLNILHYRSYIDFHIYQMVPKTSQVDTFMLHTADCELFSESDIHFFCQFFCNYALGYLEGYRYIPKPFVKSSNSNLLLFGYFQDEYFFFSYDDQDEYYKAKQLYSESTSSQYGVLENGDKA